MQLQIEFTKSNQLPIDFTKKYKDKIKSQEIYQLRHHGDNCKYSECKELGIGSYFTDSNINQGHIQKTTTLYQ